MTGFGQREDVAKGHGGYSQMTGEPYKISVIVPVYNKEDYLRECVDSILKQDYQNMEIILVDDASTDHSGRICDDYGRSNACVHVIHQENGGPTAACVAGMRAADGDYYMFIDSDDYVDPQMLTGMAAHLTGKRGEIICCNHLLEKQKSTEPVYSNVEPGVYEGEELTAKIKEKLIGQERKVIPLSRCMKLCEKSVFAENEKYYDYGVRFGDDSNMMYPALLNSTRVVIMEEALYYHYRYVEGSIIHRYDAGIYESVQKLMKALSRAARDKQAPDGERAVAREYCYMLLYVMKNELRGPGSGYKVRIREIFGNQENKRLFADTQISVNGKANKVLYLAAKHPNGILPCMIRVVLTLYDR